MPFAIRTGFGVKPARIRITSVPPGDAPLWVREKWVSVELVSVLGSSPKDFPGASVLAPPSYFASLWRLITGQSRMVNGYPVQVLASIEALEKTSPEAAMWWRQNTPQLLSPHRLFVFDANVCEVVEPPTN
jgi:hypothetical protein